MGTAVFQMVHEEAPLDRDALLVAHAADLIDIRDRLGEKLTPPATDQECLGFMRAAEFDLSVAAERLQATWAWRQEQDIEGKMMDAKFVASERELRRVLLYDYLGVDRHGRPVLVERVGAWDAQAVILAAEPLERFVTLHAMACETLRRFPRPAGTKDVRGTVLVLDLQGFGLRLLCRQLLQTLNALNEVDSAHYPDSLAHIFVVNAPVVVSVLINAVARFIDPTTLTKLSISSDVPQEMVDILGAECLPTELHGTRCNVFPYDLLAEPASFL